MTAARARVLAALDEYGDLGFAPDGARAARRRLVGRRQGARGPGGARPGGGAARRGLSRLDPGAGPLPLSPAQARRPRRCAPRCAPAATRRRCSRASPARARPRSTSRRSPRRCASAARRWCCCPRSRSRPSSSTGSRRASAPARPSGTRASPRPPAAAPGPRSPTGDARLVVGARSALFLPFRDLGLVVVDEEHDGSYKQEDGALYHARDMAVLRASIEGAAVVLASATPCLETWANADAGKYARLDLPERFGVAELPEMRAIDLRERAARARALDLRAAGAGGRRAARRRRAGAPLPQPPRLRAADHLPRLRPPGRLRRTATRAWSSTASASAWSATSAARPSRSPTPAPPARSRGG